MARNFGGIGPVRAADRTKMAAVLVIALLFALSAIIIIVRSGSSSETTTAPATIVVEKDAEIRMVDVLVPVREIEPGTALEPGMFRRESRPAIAVDARTVKDHEQIRGFFARSLIVGGQPLHQDYITAVKPVNAITANIPEGYRAVTIRVDTRTSVEGYVRPGAKVDVVWNSTVRGKQAVRTIVQNAKVLSAERTTNTESAPGAPVPTTVTLLVIAKDAQKIELALSSGSLSLALRGDTDEKGVADGMVTLDDILKDEAEKGAGERYVGSVVIGGQKYNLTEDGRRVPAE